MRHGGKNNKKVHREVAKSAKDEVTDGVATEIRELRETVNDVESQPKAFVISRISVNSVAINLRALPAFAVIFCICCVSLRASTAITSR